MITLKLFVQKANCTVQTFSAKRNLVQTFPSSYSSQRVNRTSPMSLPCVGSVRLACLQQDLLACLQPLVKFSVYGLD